LKKSRFIETYGACVLPEITRGVNSTGQFVEVFGLDSFQKAQSDAG